MLIAGPGPRREFAAASAAVRSLTVAVRSCLARCNSALAERQPARSRPRFAAKSSRAISQEAANPTATGGGHEPAAQANGPGGRGRGESGRSGGIELRTSLTMREAKSYRGLRR